MPVVPSKIFKVAPSKVATVVKSVKPPHKKHINLTDVTKADETKKPKLKSK